MAHFLTTNWTEKIKTNPVANMILNSNRRNLYQVNLTKLEYFPAKGKKINKGFIQYWLDEVPDESHTFDDENFSRIKKLYPSRKQYIHTYNKVVDAQRKADADAGIEVKEPDEDDYTDAADVPEIHQPTLMDVEDEWQEGDMWANTYVDDYINIHHPKLRHDYVTLITGRPLQIKPPSVFFSDV